MGALKPPTKSALVTALPLLIGSGADEGAPILLSASGRAGQVQGQVDAFRGLLGPLGSGPRPHAAKERHEKGGESLPGALTQAGLRTMPPQRGGRVFEADLNLGFIDPISGEAALTRGFGAVFAGGDAAACASLTFFDATGAPLGIFYVPEAAGPGALSFIGIYFGASLISQVRVAGIGGAAAVDEIIFGTPVPARASAAFRHSPHHLARWGLNGQGDAPRSSPLRAG